MTPRRFAAILILIGALGFVMNEILLRVEKRLFRWRWEVTL